MPPYLPGETTDTIIRAVPEWDKSTLCSCSLVCHAWLPASRIRLFAEINIKCSAEKYHLLVDRVLRSDYMRPYLRMTRSIVAGRISSDAVQATSSFFLLFYGCFPRLETLRFHDAWPGPIPFPGHRPGDPLLFNAFTSLKQLEFSNCTFHSFVVLRRMITALPNLEELITHVISVQNISPLPLSCRPVAGVPKLRRLKMTGAIYSLQYRETPCLVSLMSWLAMTPTARELNELSFHVTTHDDSGPDQIVSEYMRGHYSLRIMTVS